MTDIRAFLRESLMIEGIHREPTDEEGAATIAFLVRPRLDVADVVALVSVYQPDAVLRDKPGLNVRVGDYIAPRGGPAIAAALGELLDAISIDAMTPREAHMRYEALHPFTDGNGRSGRAIWLWHMRAIGQEPQLSFLHHWYYQTLSECRP